VQYYPKRFYSRVDAVPFGPLHDLVLQPQFIWLAGFGRAFSIVRRAHYQGLTDSNQLGGQFVMNRMIIGTGKFIFISQVIIVIHLLTSKVVAGAEGGLSPFTAIPLNDGRNAGTLAPGEARWYRFVPGGNEAAFQRRVDLTLFFTPDDGNRSHLINFQIFSADQIARSRRDGAGHMQNLGAGGVVSRDGNPLTGEMLWSGWVSESETYYIRVLNGADVSINYWLFTDNVIAAELGPRQNPTPAAHVSAGINLDHSPVSSPSLEVPAGADGDHLLPEASESSIDHLLVEPMIRVVPAGTPTRLVIPAIALKSRITPVGWESVLIDGATYRQWRTTDNLVGWHNLSAKLGQPGNTVLNGHSNVNGAVFRNLKYVEIGDEITIFSGKQDYHYIITQKFSVKEKDVSLEKRIENAKLIAPTQDERLTLITCANPGATHRLIVVARPLSSNLGGGPNSHRVE
jgi:LPXTG-site transpeptidase (sortase) family protein